jgi:hypothetical protein
MTNKNNGKSIISSFKKFSELSKSPKSEINEISELPEKPLSDSDLPANPNLPYNKSKVERPSSIKYMQPQDLNPEDDQEDEDGDEDITDEDDDDSDEKEIKENINFYGKVAKLPNGTKASKGYNFLENVKVSKSSIWYILVEKQDNELQMVKYNHKKGVDLSKFVSELKTFYVNKYKNNQEVCKLIEAIKVDGNDKYSKICNIPLVEVEGKKVVTKITEDLIKLLSK